MGAISTFVMISEFCRALMPPGYHKEWHIGVRVVATKKLVAFISGVPMTLRVRKKQVPVFPLDCIVVYPIQCDQCDGNQLPLCTQAVTIKTTCARAYQGGHPSDTPERCLPSYLYCWSDNPDANINLQVRALLCYPPSAYFCARYYHRSLNVPKLVDVGFCYVPRNMTQARMIRLNAVPEKPSLAGLREIEDNDVLHVASLFTKFMKRYDVASIFDLDEIKHQFLSGKGQVATTTPHRREGQVTWTYVVEVRPLFTCCYNLGPIPHRIPKHTKSRTSSRSIVFPPQSLATRDIRPSKPHISTTTRRRSHLTLKQKRMDD